MKSIELNPKGNFDSWPPHLLAELQNIPLVLSLGQKLLYESKDTKIWTIKLQPGERLPFRRIHCNFGLVSLDDAMLITRSGCGRIGLHHVDKGDVFFSSFENRETIYDLENMGENSITIYLFEFKADVIGNG